MRNKLDADWTYPMIKVIQMRENIDETNEETNQWMNKWTNEQTNERVSESTEQKFMNEILRKTREIEKNLFFQLSQKFLQNIERMNFFLEIGLRHILGITILHHCAKNQEKLMSR